MAAGIDPLIQALQRAASGETIDVEYARTLKFDVQDANVGEAAARSWSRLVNFADDIDIRSEDPDYDKQMKEEMEWRWRELSALLTGRR
ncbi:hypothetical protein LPJ38_30485 [Bradyrhizobium daqingense]|uniref:Uncharacterized protein n=1 Tax=Bradyrhizobium daqingense TaxID=993502 RepID=A0A562LPN1_9BRAD|nr:hypothetical protein [Bradyrhizobium daqingense]TWI09591.1 hypothetical protein IQ17_00668 [Bradyrhizobium daqingense]UFS87921.1 hypothetical protein LPJ38_30485 [Bradyrhizobium daqingense]